MILLDGVYLHSYGGNSILSLLINHIIKNKLTNHFFLLLDSRYKNKFNLEIKFESIYASEYQRRKFYLKNSSNFSNILCLGNVPPPVKLKLPVLIYFHNELFLDFSKSNLNFKQKLITKLKFYYIRYKSNKNYNWAVQTNRMKEILYKKIKLNKNNISVYPVFEEKKINKFKKEKNTFLYVSNSMPHKNLNNLLSAFLKTIKKSKNIIELHLTSLETDVNIRPHKKYNNFKIYWHGKMDKDKLDKIYQKIQFFVFPSLKESFGLPLIEATQNHCKIIASDLPFVHEIIEPSLVFDPYSQKSISKALNLALKSVQLKNSKIKVKSKISNLIEHLLKQNLKIKN